MNVITLYLIYQTFESVECIIIDQHHDMYTIIFIYKHGDSHNLQQKLLNKNISKLDSLYMSYVKKHFIPNKFLGKEVNEFPKIA